MFIFPRPELLTPLKCFFIHFDMFFTDEVVKIAVICFTGVALSLLEGWTISMSGSRFPDKFSIKTEEAEHYLISHLGSGSCCHLSKARTSKGIFVGMILINVISISILFQLTANPTGLKSEWGKRPGGMT